MHGNIPASVDPEWKHSTTILKPQSKANVMTGYKLTRHDSGTWMFCGTTPEEVANCLRAELESDMEPGNEAAKLTLEPFEFTQDEIDNMPEFPGW